jgi:hypothetical protein
MHKFQGYHYLDYFGWSVAGVGDVNHDGFPDLAVGSDVLHDGPAGKDYSWKTYGGFYVFSGKDYSQLLRVVASEEYQYLGVSISGAGDFNHDGSTDILVGASNANPNGVMNAGSAFIYSGTGVLLARYDGANRGDFVGYAVAGLGDINADGIGDIAVGVPNLAVSGGTRAGAATVYASTPSCGTIAFAFDGFGRLSSVDLGVLAIPGALMVLATVRWARRRARR